MKTEMIEAVAFDMDGLMFETESIYWQSADELLKRRGFQYTDELAEQVMGRPPEYCFKLFIERFGLTESWRALQQESESIFLDILSRGFAVQPGLFELLEFLQARQIPCCVCTSSAQQVASVALREKDVLRYMSFVLTSDDIVQGKPAPEAYLKASSQFSVPPSHMLVLEDSVAGCRASRSAGSPCVMLKASHNAKVDFSGAEMVVERLDDPRLLAFIRP
ncbi:MAG: HAD-IA family hydrolase [Planctomycetia bacterium]|nr:HAD-IA family hydrolase [Planctomycetia bacterium]